MDDSTPPPVPDAPDAPDVPPQQPLSAPARLLMQALAFFFLGLAILGAFVPLLPTVPFLLLSAWAAARSSPRLSRWLHEHPRFGPLITDWRRDGVVRRSSKWKATAAMAFSAVVILLVVRTRWAALGGIGSMACVLVWLWRRPEQPGG